MANERILEGLQLIVMSVSQQADGHQIQSCILRARVSQSWLKSTQSMLRKSESM